MIDSKELRIGNWVAQKNAPDFHFQIESVNDEGVDLELEDISTGYISHYIIRPCYKIEEIGPIPITEQWLQDFGFARHSEAPIWSNSQSDDPYQLTAININGWFEYEIQWMADGEVYTDVPGPNIKCVHQLQNLYFALTGEELTIKEKAGV